jgi:REP element-mobilizing transposase RayT
MNDHLRYWFLTSTTYGTWLPGDARSFVSSFPQEDGEFEIHNDFDTPYDRDSPDWKRACEERLTGEPIYFGTAHADAVLEQILETTNHRGWTLYIVSIMASHLHALVAAPVAVQSKRILGDYKAYASRKLTGRWGKPSSETWWTESGSRRPVYGERSFEQVYDYILNQPNCLAQWRLSLDSRLILPIDNRSRS